ncbi:hypothetical protein BSZ35_02770 [Salinibacter sp. 10B]|nr:hypothetical protein BSZ35_02770 [Salinibacter sp. 10B]
MIFRCSHPDRVPLPLRILAPVLVCGLLLTGCSLFGEEESVGSDGVTATVQDEAIVIKNRRSGPVWVRMIGVSVLPTVLLAPPDLDGEPIPAGEQRVVEFEVITMGENEDAIRVFWWGATMDDGKRVPGEVSSFRVEL